MSGFVSCPRISVLFINVILGAYKHFHLLRWSYLNFRPLSILGTFICITNDHIGMTFVALVHTLSLFSYVICL